MSHLPVEVLYSVLLFVKESDATTNSLHSCSLVCKSWNQTTQYPLYSKVVIKRTDALQQFVASIKTNDQLSNLVKEVCMTVSIRDHDQVAFADLFSHLPNLEVFCSNHRINFKPILDALTDFKLTQLKNITVLPLTKEDYDFYATCVMLMKDRIENVTIANQNTITDMTKRANHDVNRRRYEDSRQNMDAILKGRARFNRLINRLRKFPKLKDIFLTNETNDPISILESISKKCSNLQTLRFDFENDYSAPRIKYDDSIVYKCTPNSSLENLHGIEFQYHREQFLPYVMAKYTHLQSLYLDTKYTNLSKAIRKETANQFFTYLSKTNVVKVYGLCINRSDFFDIFCRFWSSPSNPAPKCIEIIYGHQRNERVTLDVLEIDKLKGRNYTQIHYDRQTGDVLEHTKIIEEFGYRFKKLGLIQSRQNLAFDTSFVMRKMFFGNFIDHILCHCPNLEDLYISKVRLYWIDFSKFHASNQKMHIRTFEVTDSDVNHIVLAQLSTVFKSIKHLKSFNNDHGSCEEFIPYHLANIDMADTEIGTLTMDFSGAGYSFMYLKIFTKAVNEFRYYKFDFENPTNGVLLPSYEDERKNAHNYWIHINCESLSRIELIYKNVYASMSFK